MSFITLTRLDGSTVLFNTAHIISVVAPTAQSHVTADAVINMSDGKAQAVLETVDEVAKAIKGIDFQ